MAKYMLIMRGSDEAFEAMASVPFEEMLERVGRFNDELILVRRQGGRQRARDPDALRAGVQERVLPGVLGHGLADPRAHRRIAQPLPHRVSAPLVHPWWEAGGEGGAREVVGIYVRGDRQPFGAGSFHGRDGDLQPRPVPAPGRLEVIDLRSGSGVAGDGDQLLHPGHQAASLASQMGGVEAVVGGDHLAQTDQFGGGVARLRWVDESRRESHRPAPHLLVQESAHPLELALGQGPVVVARLVRPQRPRADERGHVRRDPTSLEPLQVSGQRGPFHVVLVARGSSAEPTVRQPLPHRRVQRAHRGALAHDLERHALPDVAHRSAVLDQRFDRPAQHVDETRGDGQPADIDLMDADALHLRA